jgi:flagellar biosynthesis/type III secretory pathway protein FliH
MDKELEKQLKEIQRSAKSNNELLEEAFELGFRAGYSKRELEIGEREAELAETTKYNPYLSQ